MQELVAPLLVELELTESCNLRCKHCYNPYALDRSAPSPIDLRDRLEAMVKELASSGVFHLLITGGEPLSNLKTFELVLRHAYENRLDTSVNTNGTLLSQEAIDLLIKYQVKHVLVSICGSTAAVHDSVTGVSGSHERTMNGIRRLVAARVPFAVNMVVQQSNLEQVLDTARVLHREGVGLFSATPISPCEASPEHKGMTLDPPQILEAWDQMLEAENSFGIRVTSVNPVPLCAAPALRDRRYGQFLRTKCAAGRLTVCVSHNGDIRACTHAEKVYGNMLCEGLTPGWQALREWRDDSLLPSFCLHECGLYDGCRGGCRTAAKASTQTLAGRDPLMCEKNVPNEHRMYDGTLGADAQANTDRGRRRCGTRALPDSLIESVEGLRFREEHGGRYLVFRDMTAHSLIDGQEFGVLAAVCEAIREKPGTVAAVAEKLDVNERNLAAVLEYLADRDLILISDG